MPKTDPDPLGDGFKWRLRAELNRISPRYSPPRYLAPRRGLVRAWRFAPIGLAAGIVGMLGLTAFAATGSPNPVVWTQHIVTRIVPSEGPTAAPSSEPSEQPPSPRASDDHAPPTARPAATQRPEPSERPEPSGTPEPSETPEPGDGGHSGSPGDS